jgi:NitT/TauT family transport system substrate-binding protein
LVAGNIDGGNPSMPAVGEGLVVGLDLVNVYTYSTGAIFGIFATEGSGITSIADLAGKNIGISEPGGGEVAFLEASLIKEGIDPITGATLIPIGDGGPETFAAIEGGQVDAYSTAYNDIFALQTQGLNLVDLTPAEFNTFPARGIITTSAKLEEKGEAWGRFAQGTAMGTHFCLNNNEACIEMLKGVIPAAFEQNQDGISQGDLRFALSLKQVPPADQMAYGAHNEAGTTEFLALIASTIPDAQEVDLAKFLNTDYLAFANEFDRARVEADAANY